MWVFIDCYDSFSYSLIDLLKRSHHDVMVIHYDDPNLLHIISSLQPQRIILSPGPGHPKDYPILFDVIASYQNVPILGVCLGHQIIGEFFGRRCITSGSPLHGKVSQLKILHHHPIFSNIPEDQIRVMHYHSLIVDIGFQDDELKVLALDEKKQVMMFEHRHLPILGIQFHPESILTSYGKTLIENWSKMY